MNIANITDDAIGESSTQYEDSLSAEPLSGLSDVQEMVLAILPIPSSMLSIFGSACIIYMSLKSREKKTWTPYTRLLMGMSICDIVSSITLAIAAFLRPHDNNRVWTFGSEATCSAIGMLTQFSYSGLFYNSMLSLYFLLSTRFRLKNRTIARLFEPLMHFLSLGFPIVTAVLGGVMGVYSTTTSELGCWVNDYPRGCIGEECLSITIGWYYFGMPFLMSFAIIGFCNIAILIFVRFKTRPKTLRRSSRHSNPVGDLGDTLHSKSGHSKSGYSKSAGGTDVNTTVPPNPDEPESGGGGGGSSALLTNSSPKTPDRDDSSAGLESSFRSLPSISWGAINFRKSKPNRFSHQSSNSNNNLTNSTTMDSEVRKQQTKRLRLVLTQALLFVASFFFTAGWLGLLRIIESMAETPEDELRMVVQIYPLMVINAFMAPLQGFFNMLVFIRPKFLKWRNEFPLEKRTWVFQRCIFGPQVRPTIRYVKKPLQPPDPTSNRDTNVGLMMEPSRFSQQESQFQSITEEHEDDDDEYHNTRGGRTKVVDNTPDFYFPRSMVSSLTASGVEEDDNDYNAQYPPNPPPPPRRNSNHSGSRSSTRLHSLVASGSSLEVISELSVSVFEAHPSSHHDDDEDEDGTMSFDYDDDDYDQDDDDVEQRQPPPVYPSMLGADSDGMITPDTSDRWSADNSDRSPASPRINRRVALDGTVHSSDTNQSNSRWSACSGGGGGSTAGGSSKGGSTSRRPIQDMMFIPQRVVSEYSEVGIDSLLEQENQQDQEQPASSSLDHDHDNVLTSPTPTKKRNPPPHNNPMPSTSADSSVASADTPLQPPTRRLSPSEIEIPDAPGLE